MNAEQLTAIKERAKKAAVGEWKYDASVNEVTCGEYIIARETDYENDALFIAAARQDVPALVAEIERLTTVKHRLNSEVEKYRKLYEGTAIQLGESDSENERLSEENKRLEDKVLDVAKKSYSDGYFDGKSDYY